MDIFERFPYLRMLIGDHGGPIKQCRPTTERAAVLFDKGSLDAYAIVDVHNGWERQLLPVAIETLTRKPSWLFHLRRLNVKFKILTQVGFDFWPMGLVFVEDQTNALFVNKFHENHTDMGDLPIRYDDKFKINYELQFEPDFFEDYVPFEDLEFTPRIGHEEGFTEDVLVKVPN